MYFNTDFFNSMVVPTIRLYKLTTFTEEHITWKNVNKISMEYEKPLE